jgi:hypothetical protein
MALTITNDTPNTFSSNDSDANARRVRLRPKPGNAVNIVYGTGLLNPLRTTNGLVWPYQPTITYAQDVTYTNIDLVHTNQEMYAYTRTNAVKLVVDGQFSVQNQTEGVYALACIHFLRTVTKMYFGQTDQNAGTPPPILLFDAYGDFMFNQLPVIVTNFSVTLPNDVDYMPINVNNLSTLQSITQPGDPYLGNNNATVGTTADQISYSANAAALQVGYNYLSQAQPNGSVWLPTAFGITVNITVQNTPSVLRQQFNLDSFRSGQLLLSTNKGVGQQIGGWI